MNNRAIKLCSLLCFVLSNCDVQRVFKGNKTTYSKLFKGWLYKKLAKVTLKKAPKWVEMCYMNSLEFESNYTLKNLFIEFEKKIKRLLS